MIAWLLISFFVLLFLGVPIAMSLGLSAIGGILFLGGGSTVTIAQRMFEGMNSWALLAIPLYTFAGYTMSKGRHLQAPDGLLLLHRRPHLRRSGPRQRAVVHDFRRYFRLCRGGHRRCFRHVHA